MIPKEKWDRLNNLTCVEDYGLFLTETEMRTFPEGREILLDIQKVKREDRRIKRWIFKVGESARETIDNVILKVLNEHSTNNIA